jgi:hypothetical protein
LRLSCLVLFWGVDDPPIDAAQTPSVPLQQVTAAELACAKGHVYPLLLVRLALTWVTEAHTSYRAAALIFSTLNGQSNAVGPCAETIRLWLLRVGLFLLRRPLPRYTDWIYLLDLTIQLGQHQCLVILGISRAKFCSNGYRLDHGDVQVLAVQVLTHGTAETVAHHLTEVQRRTGTPLQIVADHGTDVQGGIRLFQAKHAGVIETYDITHVLAGLLKGYLEDDARWQDFVTAVGRTRQQLQQTPGSFLQPPAWRQKARYLNLEGHLAWANDMLLLLFARVDATLAKQLGSNAEQSKIWLEEQLGWLREYQEDVRQWSYFQKVVKYAQSEIKHNGLCCTSRRRIRQALQEDRPATQPEKRFLRDALALVDKEGSKVPAGEHYVGSTDVLESLFGKYKDLAEHGPCREITANVLMIPLFVTSLTADLLRQALESVHEQDVHLWVQEQLGPSPQQKKRAVLDTSRQDCEGPNRE